MAQHAEQPDWNALMTQVAQGRDRRAFATIAKGFAGRLKGFLCQRGVSDADAEELVQQTLIRVWQRAAQFDPVAGHLNTWLFRIARNLHIDLLRRQGTAAKAAPVLENDEPTTAPGPETNCTDQRRAQQVQAALAQLPERQRQVVHMAFYQAKTHAEIASELDMPLGSVKSALRLAFNKLRSSMEDNL